MVLSNGVSALSPVCMVGLSDVFEQRIEKIEHTGKILDIPQG